MKAYSHGKRQCPIFRARKLELQRLWRKARPDAFLQPSYRFASLNRKAKSRGLEVTLTLEQFTKLIENECTYCGGSTVNYGSGLDRVDSTRGYTLENSVPCCYLCNVMKSDLTLEAFYEQAQRIIDYRKH
jgi:hypothetical protein